MKSKIFNFYSDPGHGWLAVTRKDLEKAGVAREITSYSYQRGDMVFLEEDGDASTFLAAIKKQGIEPRFREYSGDRRSRIRNYASYKHQSS
jgi:hypothetical protein